MATRKYPNEIHRDEHDETSNTRRVSILQIYSNPSDWLQERVSNTDGNSTALSTFDASSGQRNCITMIVAHNSSATDGYVDIRDGTGGSVIATLPLPSTGGAVCPFFVPLRQPTANTALAYDVSAALSTVYLTFVGYKSDT